MKCLIVNVLLIFLLNFNCSNARIQHEHHQHQHHYNHNNHINNNNNNNHNINKTSSVSIKNSTSSSHSKSSSSLYSPIKYRSGSANRTKSLKLSVVHSYSSSENFQHNNNNNINHNNNKWNNNENTEEKTTTVRSFQHRQSSNNHHQQHHEHHHLKQHHHQQHHQKQNQHSTGRRVCTKHKTVHVPEVYKEVYDKPVARQYSEPCHGQQICTGVRIVHEKAYRDVIRHRATEQVIHYCCPGWDKVSENSQDCNKPICAQQCKNGGICTEPNTCSCSNGFTGNYCERDINECKEEKPCDQYCFNTEGSYYCTCREGFVLHTDKQSCKKIETSNDASEVRDLNDYLEYDKLNSRITQVETSLELGKTHMTKEMNQNMRNTLDNINSLRVRIDTMEHRQYDLVEQIKNKLKDYDLQARKFEHFIDMHNKYKY